MNTMRRVGNPPVPPVNLRCREMLLYEALARIRMREPREAARRDWMARQLVVARRWARLARFADRRAERTRWTIWPGQGAVIAGCQRETISRSGTSAPS